MITFKKRYNTFTASRGEYWAVLIAVAIANSGLDVSLGQYPSDSMLVISGLMYFGLLAVLLTVTAARCRDAGLNGWWTVASFIPFAGLYFGCIRNDDHPKKLRAFEKLRANDKGALFK